MRSFIQFIACFTLVMILSACGGSAAQSPQERIVGKWRVIELNSGGQKTAITADMANSLVYEFFSDGSLTIHLISDSGPKDIKGSYTLRENGELSADSAATGPLKWDAVIDGNRLTLKDSSTGDTTVLQRE